MIGVVVPVRDGAPVLGEQLTALQRQDYSGAWRVYVADNGSTDATVAVARSFAGSLPLTVVDAGAVPGINRARNAGSRAALEDGAEVLVFCDADDAVDPGWLAAMARASTVWDAWGGALDRTRFSDPARLRPAHRRSTGLIPWNGYLPFASGANLGVRARVWARLGGFDESFCGGGDDVDFCWRVQQAGFSLGFQADAVVHYRERPSLRGLARQFRGYGRQDPRLYRNHREHGMPPSSFRDGVRGWAHLVVHAPRSLRRADQRGQWVRWAARRFGRIEGSIRARTLYL